jgi:hypothetical protein
MYLNRARMGVSKLAVPVALVVILVVAGAYVFLARGSTVSTQSTSAGSLPSTPVHSAVNQLVQYMNDRNVDGVVTFYNQNSVVVWSGKTGGLSGMYSGGNIRLTYATTVGKTTQLDVNMSNYVEKAFSPTHVNTTFVMGMLGKSPTAGNLTATINVSEEWNWGNAGWQISKENWAYKYFDASLLDANLGSQTTFPQWGYSQVGGNPNLVSEKSLEWHAGPSLAAVVYAFLFSAVFVLAVTLRSRGKGGQPGEETSRYDANQKADGHPQKARRSDA